MLGALLAGLLVDRVILRQIVRLWARNRGVNEVTVALVLARMTSGLTSYYLRRVRGNDSSVSLITSITQGLVLVIGTLVIVGIEIPFPIRTVYHCDAQLANAQGPTANGVSTA